LLVGLALVYIPLLLNSIEFSFSTISRHPVHGVQVTNMGFQNYITALLPDDQGGLAFGTTLVDGFVELFLTIPPIIVFSLFIAVLLNQKMMGRAAFRAIYFIPVIIATGLMDTLAQGNLMQGVAEGAESGYAQAASAGSSAISQWQISAIFELMAIGGEVVDFVMTIMEAVFNVINRSGVQILIFLAGLQAIPGEVYESCRIDGASSWETFWKITLPMISPMILVNLVYSIINSFTAADNTVMNRIASVFTDTGGLNVSTAMGWLYFLMIAAVVSIVMGIMSLFVFYQRRD